MEKFNNIETFLNNYPSNKRIPKYFRELVLFTSFSKFHQMAIYKSPFTKISKDKKDDKYTFNYNDKTYDFWMMTDFNLQKVDLKILKSPKRMIGNLSRSLKLACSMDLVNPRVAIGNSCLGKMTPIILFGKDGKEKVMDYARNLIMKKEEYYDIFNFQELNVVDKYDLYRIFEFADKFHDFGHLQEYLLFSKEIFEDLSRQNMFYYINEKYDFNSCNRNNYVLFGNDCDSLFFQKMDYNHMKHEKVVREIDEFTLNPKKLTKHISLNNGTAKYIFKDKKIGNFKFNLLSDFIKDTDIKSQLLSEHRFGKCHENAQFMANVFGNENEDSVYIVGGQIKENETNYFYHSWVEVDDAKVVIDFNHNIVMPRDKYYEIYDVNVISKTSVADMNKIVERVIFDAGFNFHPMDLNYFGREMFKDLEKNEHLFQKTM